MDVRMPFEGQPFLRYFRYLAHYLEYGLVSWHTLNGVVVIVSLPIQRLGDPRHVYKGPTQRCSILNSNLINLIIT